MSGSNSYHININSFQENKIHYFKFIGRIFGKALFDQELLACQFGKSLYKLILGEPLSFIDLKDFDE